MIEFFFKKKIVLGVTASIAAYKAAYLCSRLIKMGAEVVPVMTPRACNFINPITFSSLSGNRTIIEQFKNEGRIYHISLSHSADAYLIAPASADVISKLAGGICDDFLTTSVLAATCPVLVAPAMNESMYADEVFLKNIESLGKKGKYFFIGPETGNLACGEEGLGRMAGEESIISRLKELLKISCDLSGRKVLITAGGTREYIDAVRYISNSSSGKMGYALAAEAYFRGADEVMLVSAARGIVKPYGVRLIEVENTEQMRRAVLEYYSNCDITIMAAAVCDIIPEKKYEYKLKKKEGILDFVKFRENINILRELASQKKKNQFLAGFAAEYGGVADDARQKMAFKGIDMIVANDISRKDIGMDSDYNQVDILLSDGSTIGTGRDTKRMIARIIWDNIIKSI
ncbi:MAG: bifunctional phosphopantothenoylcysteine decarboxylase/phosphopantothenate--cysteine ligase CoaBC [Actinobacteria bacterium]|nr:bifunctional phosphopantothenoylcysteine decarboxylase/phosphopantothenate--cysteine ligase CoaBC [Actinomycetota bacterium]